VAGKPGRLVGVDDTGALMAIAEDFANACTAARQWRKDRLMAYFGDIITWALDGEALRPPAPSGELVRLMNWNEQNYLTEAVSPILELACQSLTERFPAWRAKADLTGRNAGPQCRLAVKAISREGDLRFFRESAPDGNAILCYEVMSDGQKSPVETVEIVTTDSGNFAEREALEGIVGEFLYGIVCMAALPER